MQPFGQDKLILMAKLIINTEEVCDTEALRDKQKVMQKSWWNSVLFSTAETLRAIAAVLTPVGLMVVLKGAIDKMSDSVSFVQALGMADTTSLIFAGVALGSTVMAIGAGYLSSRVYHSSNFDALEVNAQHTAKYLVKEIKKETTQPTTVIHEQNCRSDGKRWVEAVGKDQQMPVRTA